MRKIILACAGDAATLQGRLRQLRTELVGHAEVMKPDPKATASGTVKEWLQQNVDKADFVVVFYGPAPAPSVSASTTQPVSAAASGEAQEARTTSDDHHVVAADVLALTTEQLAALPGDATVLVAVSGSADRERLPGGFENFRGFDVSSRDGHDALLCTLVHEPVTPTRLPLKQDAAAAVGKVVLGHVASLIGSFDKTRDTLVANVDERLVPFIHYGMVVVVVVLLFTGYVVLLRLALDSLRSVLNIETDIARLPGGRTLWQRAVVVIAAVVIVFVSARFLPKPLHVDTLVEKHLREWAQQLEKSTVEAGGFRAHRTKGETQVWTTGQALAGLLSSSQAAMISADQVRQAFGFIERTRIANFELKPKAKDKLSVQLAPYVKQTDFSKLPLRFPTFSLILGATARLGGQTELPIQARELLEQKKDEFFTITPSAEGWGYFEQFDWGVTEIAAWVGIAEIQSLHVEGSAIWSADDRNEVKRRVREIIQLLTARETPREGGYSPISDISDPSFARTYSTVMALWVMAEAASPELGIFEKANLRALEKKMRNAVRWLERHALADGWKVNPANPTDEKPFLGLTAQTLCVLARVPIQMEKKSRDQFAGIKRSLLRSASDLSKRPMNDNARPHDSDRYLYPTQRVTEGSTFLWYPWSVYLMRLLSSDTDLSESERESAANVLKRLRARVGEFGTLVESEYNYAAAEGLIGFSWPSGSGNTSSRK